MKPPSRCWSASAILLALFFTASSNQAHGSNSSTAFHRLSVGDHTEAEVSLPAFSLISAPVSPAVTSGLCHNDSVRFLEALENGTMWAVEMFDSSAKFPTGLFSGSTYFLGSFDECLSVQAGPRDGSDTMHERSFNGKYCLAKLTIPETKLQEPTNDAHARIKFTIATPLYWPLNEIWLASCIPSSCTASDLRSHLSYVIPKLEQLKLIGIPVDDVEVSVNETNCSSFEESDSGLTTGQVAMLAVIAVLISLNALGTVIDYMKEKWPVTPKGLHNEIFLCFSLRRNLKELFGRCDQDADLDPISGMKFLFMAVIIWGHRVGFTVLGTSNKLMYTVEELSYFKLALARNGLVVLETFFIMTGYLFIYTSLKKPARFSTGMSMLRTCFRRYIRLTPVYMLVVAFISTLIEKTGSGPMWNLTISTESDRCRDNWWLNALYVSNIIKPERMCLIVSWFLAANMQLYIISVPVVYLLINKPKIGKAILGFLLVTSAGIQIFFTVYYQENLWTLDRAKIITEVTESIGYRQFYFPTYLRGIPFLMGVSAGYYIHYFKTRNLKISQMKANFIHVGVVMLLVLGPLIETFLFDGSEFNVWISALYAPFPPIFRGLAISCIIYVFGAGKEWYVLKIFSWRIFRPLSRLTYCAYLLHALIQIQDVASARSAQYISLFNMVQLAISDCVFTFLLALVVSMLLEAPLINLERVNFSSRGLNAVDKVRIKKLDDQKFQSMDLER